MQLQLKIDTPAIDQVKELVSDNSKKIGKFIIVAIYPIANAILALADEHTECNMSYRLKEVVPPQLSLSPSQSPFSAAISLPVVEQSSSNSQLHGKTSLGSPATCALPVDYQPGDVVDCMACLDDSQESAISASADSDKAMLSSVLQTILAASESGCTVSELMASTIASSLLLFERL